MEIKEDDQSIMRERLEILICNYGNIGNKISSLYNFYKNILEIEKDGGKIKQAKFARTLGYSRAHISKVLKNNEKITDDFIEHVCDEFCINENWLRGNKIISKDSSCLKMVKEFREFNNKMKYYMDKYRNEVIGMFLKIYNNSETILESLKFDKVDRICNVFCYGDNKLFPCDENDNKIFCGLRAFKKVARYELEKIKIENLAEYVVDCVKNMINIYENLGIKIDINIDKKLKETAETIEEIAGNGDTIKEIAEKSLAAFIIDMKNVESIVNIKKYAEFHYVHILLVQELINIHIGKLLSYEKIMTLNEKKYNSFNILKDGQIVKYIIKLIIYERSFEKIVNDDLEDEIKKIHDATQDICKDAMFNELLSDDRKRKIKEIYKIIPIIKKNETTDID